MKNLALVLVLFVAAALVIGVVLWDDDAGPSTVPVVEAESIETEEDDAPEPVDLVESEPAPVEVAPAPTEFVQVPVVEDQRTALDDRLDGRTWADLFLPVSTVDGAPIEGARIIHIDRKGERRVVELDAPILEDDLHERAFAAIDTDAHCYRAFLPRELVEHAGDPIQIALHPSARVRFELDGKEPEVWPEFEVAIESGGWDWGLDEPESELRELGFETFEEIQPIYAFGQNLRFILSESAEPKYRRRQVRWAARTEAVRPLLELHGAPVVVGHANAKVSPLASLPVTIDDLPDGSSVDIYEDFEDQSALVDLVGPDDAELDWSDDTTYTLDAEKTLVVRVAFPTPSGVKGSIGPGHEGGSVTVSAIDADGDVSWFDVWEAEFDEDGGFAFGGLPPGAFDLVANWSAAGGARFQAQRRFELEPGQVLDLGRIDVSAGGAVTIRPVLVVDGVVDPTLLDGAFEDFEWEVSISEEVQFDSSVFEGLEEWQLEDELFMEELLASQEIEATSHYETEVAGFAETTIGGVEPGRYWVTTFFWEVPGDVGERYRVIGFDESFQIDVDGDAVHEVRFELESAAMIRIVAEVPALGVGYDEWLEVAAWNAEGEARMFDDLEESYHSSSDEPWKIDCTVALDPGDWELVVLVRCEVDTWLFDDEVEAPDLPPRSFVHRSRVSVATVDAHDTLRVDLGAGATLRGTEAAFRGDQEGWGWVQMYPVGAPVELGELWFVFAEEVEPNVPATLVVHGLLPNTEYAIEDAPRTVTTGGPGSVVDLVE